MSPLRLYIYEQAILSHFGDPLYNKNISSSYEDSFSIIT